MKLGAFSVSLHVKDLQKSKAFYEKLGFSVFAGSLEMHYLILKNENTLLGLFQGMFDKNLLTFNPGWNQEATALKDFDDVRSIQAALLNNGIALDKQATQTLKALKALCLPTQMETKF
ncbi:hypothetical protein [Ochrovirga pacifica]|uniref:hypothetical protein n=1 Tax=Ochrovirga pacifica TaxID=1042376 RepID=UPI0002559B3D|nr:hypothetical protein [Ochrovirga pacifica]